jgi:hypothetical protein
MKAQHITRALGGDWHGSYGTVPAPGHSHKDRSVSIRPHSSDPDDVVVYSFTGEDPLTIKDELRRHGLLPKRPGRSPRPTPQRLPQDVLGATPEAEAVQKSTDTALGLWRRSQPILGTLAERYLRNVRRIEGALPPTLRFLPANGRHPPAMVAAFGLADETDPDAMTIEASALRGVHLTKLCLDGRGKADMEPNKIMLGRGHTLPIVLAPMNDMGAWRSLRVSRTRFRSIWQPVWGSGLQAPHPGCPNWPSTSRPTSCV